MVWAAPAAARMAARYRDVNGLCGADVISGDQIMLRVGAITGLRIAHPLADLVRAEVVQRGLRTPTIKYSRGGNLMFLATAPSGETGLDNELFRNFAVRMSCGAMIALPGPTSGVRTWLDAPEEKLRIDFDTLARITIEVASTRSDRRKRTLSTA